MKHLNYLLAIAFVAIIATGCGGDDKKSDKDADKKLQSTLEEGRADIYKKVQLTTDVGQLSDEDKKLIPILIEAARQMDEIFWLESYGDKDTLLPRIEDEKARRFAEINYGPWDRLNNNEPFIEGVGEKPAGANFYPHDMTKEEFESWNNPSKDYQYTVIRRNEDGSLKSIPYHKFFEERTNRAAALLDSASAIASNKSLSYYLKLRAEALRTDKFETSDIAWLNLKGNNLDIIIGPIENYEDQLYGYKTAHESYVLVKDKMWSQRLNRYAQFLPELQSNLPVGDKYKQDKIGSNAQLNAYDVIYYAGDCNAGSKTIAVNLPNDESLQQNHGTRRSQLKNAMRAKYDEILVPISKVLIDDEQQKHITFEAFFGNTMFHEVAHGLGIKNTINGKGTVREALKEQHSALEEGKADILGLYMVTELFDKGEIDEGVIMDNYVTFMASIFRSVRFGASSAHGKANMLRFNYFNEKGAFTKNAKTGKYKIDFEKMKMAMNDLSELIIQLQGDGDYEAVKSLMAEKGQIGPELEKDLEKLKENNIPVDVTFEQGVNVLGLN
ncbi:dipeptidyl-peptidase 3 family protein [Halocola ammonii]